MSECSFQLKIEIDPAETLQKIKTGIEKEGGKFNGDERDGTFSLPTPVGAIEGSYLLDGNNLKIDITKKPVFLPCNMIEGELKKRF